MEPIEFRIDEAPQDVIVAPNGEALAFLFTSNMCDGEMEDVIDTLVDLWGLSSEVNLGVQIRVRALFECLMDFYGFSDGAVDADALPKFTALKQDCAWIIEQINNLKTKEIEND